METFPENKNELHDVFERITDAFVALDKNWCYTYMNKKAGEIFGRDPRKIIGKNIWEEFPEGKGQPFHKAYEAAMSEQRYVYLEEYNSSFEKWFESHIYPSPEGISIFFRDITEKKKTELALIENEEITRLIMKSALDAIVCVDRRSEITVWTPQAEKIFGWKESEILGKTLIETIIPVKYRDRHTRGFDHYLSSGHGPVLNSLIEVDALDKNGREFPIELTIIPINEGDQEFFCAFIRDITDRKKAEEDIRTSEMRYRALIEQASDAIMITDNKGTFIDVNTSFCKRFGYEKEELIGANVSSVIDAQQLKDEPIRFDLLANNEAIVRERKMLTKDGIIIEVEANVKMLPDGRILAIARDITERKRASAELEASEKKLRQVLASTTDNFYVIDRSYNIILINEAAEVNLTRAWRNPVKLGTNILNLIPRDNGERVIENFEKVFSGERIEYEYETERADLPEWILVNMTPVNDENGQVTGAYVVAKDISERKQAAELIVRERDLSDSIINSLPGIFYLIDEDIHYLRWNKNMETLMGYSAEELSRTNPLSLVAEEDRKRTQEAISLVFKEGYNSIEALALTKAGEKIPYYLTGIRTNYQDKTCMLGTGIDISEKTIAEEKLKQSYKEVRLLTEHLQQIREQERTNIAREIHDELGQQLTVLKMDASWLNKKLSSADVPIREKINDLLQLLDATVKSVRRISAELRPSLLDDLGLIAAIEWHLQEFGKRSGIRTLLEVEKNELIIPDEFKTGLYRIFQESLTNVARHAQAKEVKVSLTNHGNEIVLSIEDDGTGFDMMKASGKNTLGILGMEERTAMMGGQYRINSSQGEGTSVTVSVPAIHTTKP